jgi:hypothetical protein
MSTASTFTKESRMPLDLSRFARVRWVARLTRRKPEADPVKSSLQPNLDLSLPYWVATDENIWATCDSAEEAVEFADRLARVEPVGSRVIVTFCGISFYRTTGHNKWADRVPLTKGW